MFWKRYRFTLYLFLVTVLLVFAGVRAKSQTNGNWQIAVSYSGAASSTFNSSTGNWQTSKRTDYIQAGNSLDPYPSADLSNLINSPTSTTSGGVTGHVKAGFGIVGKDGSWSGSQQVSGAQMTFTLTWQPENGNAVVDPPPSSARIYYRRRVSVSADCGALLAGMSASGSAQASVDSISSQTRSLSVNGPNGSDSDNESAEDADFIGKTLTVSNGVATISFTLNTSLSCSTYTPTVVPYPQAPYGDGEATLNVDLAVAGFDLGRFGNRPTPAPGPSLRHLSGGRTVSSTDPTFTRWLPLAFTSTISTQPFRTVAGALPTPWGNLNCFYSIAIREEPNPPNYDFTGGGLIYLPSAGSDGTYNNPQPPYRVLTNSDDVTPAYAITDANGDRLLFSSQLTPLFGVHSTLTQLGDGSFQVQHAGPPGALKSIGHYTYTFQPLNGAPPTARLVSISDDVGNQQKCVYSLTDPFLIVTDSTSGRQLVFHLGSDGYIASVDALTPGGNTPATHTTLTYDSGGHLTGLSVYAGGLSTPVHTETYTYGGPNGDGVVSANQGVSVVNYTYVADPLTPDPFSLPIPRLSSATYGSTTDTTSSDDGGSVAGPYSYTYGPVQQGYDHWGVSTRTNTITTPRGYQTRLVYSMQDGMWGPINRLLISGPAYTGAPPGSNFWTVWYNPDIITPTQVTMTDSRSEAWVMSYDSAGNLTSFADPLSDTWQFTYDPTATLITSATDPTNLAWQFFYGENGSPASRLTSAVDPVGVKRVSLTYNSFGQLTTATIPAAASATGTDETTQLAYDTTSGDLLQITNPMGDALTINSHDALGDPTSLSVFPDTGNPATSLTPLTLTIAHDAAQMPYQVTAPTGASLATTFTNGVMSQFQIINQGATLASILLLRDTRGRVYAASDAMGTLAQYRYDRDSNLTRIIDGNNNTTMLSYGPNEELTGVTWPDQHSASVGYDALGRPTGLQDERGEGLNFAYDAANRLTNIQSSDGQNVQITYDKAARPIVITDATGSTTYNYDPTLKRVQSVATTIAALPPNQNTFTVSYTYYPDGKRATMTSLLGVTTYHYDAAGHLASLTNPFGETTTWIYDHAGRIVRQMSTSASGAQFITNYVWGVSQQPNDPSTAPAYLNGITQSVNGSTFWSYSLTHSYINQVVRQSGWAIQPGGSENETYTYDARGRLSSENDTVSWDGTTHYNESGTYQYDLANNLQAAGGGWTYNSDNQIISAPAVSGLAGAANLSYDAAGNAVTINSNTLGYDAWGRLVSVTNTPTGVVSFTYDAFGRRVSKTAGASAVYYLYDGDRLIAEIDGGSGQVVRSYTWGALGLVSDRVATQSGSISRFYMFDGLGNTRALLDASGQQVLERDAYTAWGTPYAGVPSTPFGWQGEWGAYQDAETGLVLMSKRYYAPNLGRFLSRDPAGFASGPNVYAFCLDDPVDLMDPSGEFPKWMLRGWGWYLGGMGGFSDWTDAYLMGGLTQEFGKTAGRYDVGKASAGEVAWAATKWGLQLGATAFEIYGPPRIVGGILFRPFTAVKQLVTHWDTTEQIAEMAENGLRPGSWVMTSGPTFRNYLFSGVIEKGYPFGESISTVVQRETLHWPSGWEWFKGFIGQRIYLP